MGSLQKYVDSDGDCEEWGASQFPVEDVHRIAILDMRLANTDRNGSNILVRRRAGQCQLTPIDHGMILPASVEDVSFEWLFWPQVWPSFCHPVRACSHTLWTRAGAKNIKPSEHCPRRMQGS